MLIAHKIHSAVVTMAVGACWGVIISNTCLRTRDHAVSMICARSVIERGSQVQDLMLFESPESSTLGMNNVRPHLIIGRHAVLCAVPLPFELPFGTPDQLFDLSMVQGAIRQITADGIKPKVMNVAVSQKFGKGNRYAIVAITTRVQS